MGRSHKTSHYVTVHVLGIVGGEGLLLEVPCYSHPHLTATATPHLVAVHAFEVVGGEGLLLQVDATESVALHHRSVINFLRQYDMLLRQYNRCTHTYVMQTNVCLRSKKCV